MKEVLNISVILIIIFLSLLSIVFLNTEKTFAMEDLMNINAEIKEIDGHQMIKLRDLTYRYHWLLSFRQKEKRIIINNRENIVSFVAGNKYYNEKELEKAPVIINGRTYIGVDLMRYLFKDLEEQKYPDLVTGLTVDRTEVEPEDNLNAEIYIYNVTEETIILKYSSGQLYDLFLNKKGNRIWRWSEDKFFTMALIAKDLNPEELLRYDIEIPVSRDFGIGQYKLEGEIKTQKPLFLNKIKIIIQKE